MTTLEQELRALAAEAFPETPDLTVGMLERLEAASVPAVRRGRRRRVLAVTVALAVAVGVAFAVPQARSAILEWLGIGGVSVESVDAFPVVPLDRPPIVGVPTTLPEASRRVGFAVLVPRRELGDPNAVYVGRFTVDEVTLLYGRPRAVRVLLTEVGGELDAPFARKLVLGSGGRIRELSIDGRPALWITGAPHEFVFIGRNGEVVSAPLRLDKNVLLWQRGNVLFRLEGDLGLARAIRIARSLG